MKPVDELNVALFESSVEIRLAHHKDQVSICNDACVCYAKLL